MEHPLTVEEYTQVRNDIIELQVRVEALGRVIGILAVRYKEGPTFIDKALKAAESDIRADLLRKHANKPAIRPTQPQGVS
jgi:hypothetical protein